MKKAVVYMLVMAFVLSIVSVAFARTLEEEKAAVRSYLKVIDAKIVKYRKMGSKVKMVQLQGEKKNTLARWAKLQASMMAPVAPSPVAAPVLPPPPVVVVTRVPSPLPASALSSPQPMVRALAGAWSAGDLDAVQQRVVAKVGLLEARARGFRQAPEEVLADLLAVGFGAHRGSPEPGSVLAVREEVSIRFLSSRLAR